MDEKENLVLSKIINETLVLQDEKKKKVSFLDDVKFKFLNADLLHASQEAGIMCTVDGELIFIFTKNMWISDLETSCHITNNISGLCDIIDINELVQGS